MNERELLKKLLCMLGEVEWGVSKELNVKSSDLWYACSIMERQSSDIDRLNSENNRLKAEIIMLREACINVLEMDKRGYVSFCGINKTRNRIVEALGENK